MAKAEGAGQQRRLISPSTEKRLHEHAMPNGDPPQELQLQAQPQAGSVSISAATVLQAQPRVVSVSISAATVGAAAEPTALTSQPPPPSVPAPAPAPVTRAPGSLLAKSETVAEKRARLEHEREEEARFNALTLLQKSLSAAQTQEEAARSELRTAAKEQARLQTELDEANHVIESAAARTLQRAFSMRWKAMLKGDADALKEERRAFTLIAMQQESQALRVTLSEKRVELVSGNTRGRTHARTRRLSLPQQPPASLCPSALTSQQTATRAPGELTLPCHGRRCASRRRCVRRRRPSACPPAPRATRVPLSSA